MPGPTIITVTCEGGVVQDVSDVPDGFEVHVLDYEIDGSEVGLETDANGDQFTRDIY